MTTRINQMSQQATRVEGKKRGAEAVEPSTDKADAPPLHSMEAKVVEQVAGAKEMQEGEAGEAASNAFEHTKNDEGIV